MICPDCGKETENEQRLCKGACASERYHGVPEDQITDGILACDCCDDCRDKCHESFLDEYNL